MKTFVAVAVVSMALGVADAASASEALASSRGCFNCHAVDGRKIGPSFKEVAAKYRGRAEAEAAVTAKLAAGKEHPAAKASPDELRALVRWVLATP